MLVRDLHILAMGNLDGTFKGNVGSEGPAGSAVSLVSDSTQEGSEVESWLEVFSLKAASVTVVELIVLDFLLKVFWKDDVLNETTLGDILLGLIRKPVVAETWWVGTWVLGFDQVSASVGILDELVVLEPLFELLLEVCLALVLLAELSCELSELSFLLFAALSPALTWSVVSTAGHSDGSDKSS